MSRMVTARARLSPVLLGAVVALLARRPAAGSDCTRTSTGMVPISELGTGLYLGQFEGGLYPGGVDTMPADHQTDGSQHAAAIQPRNTAGQPDPDGKVVLMSVGVCNASLEFCSDDTPPCSDSSFVGQALAEPVDGYATRPR